MESTSTALADLIHNLQQEYDTMDHEERIKRGSAGLKLQNRIDSYTKILLNPEPVKNPKADRASARERAWREKIGRYVNPEKSMESSRNAEVVSPSSSSTSKTDTMDHEERIKKGTAGVILKNLSNFFLAI